jgi:hypothetical protein
MRIDLPEYARVVRELPPGEHEYVALLPLIRMSPAARRIAFPAVSLDHLLGGARVRIEPGHGYIWVDVEAPAIVLVEHYYRRGNPRDLYLDMIHELVHLRQLTEGHNLWDDRYPYVDRPTEIEGYAVAIEEGLRLGMSEAEILEHLSNPWMTSEEVTTLRRNVELFWNRTSGYRPQGET